MPHSAPDWEEVVHHSSQTPYMLPYTNHRYATAMYGYLRSNLWY
jgi:hypothetical protein